MKIDEIEIIPPVEFNKEQVKHWLSKSSPRGKLGEYFNINYVEHQNERGVILTDAANQIVAFVGFEVKLDGRVWQAKNAVVFDPYKGDQIVGQVYQLVKNNWEQSIQSDYQQTTGGKKLWTKTLPGLGLRPMVFDTVTDRIIDPATSEIDVYNTDEPHRYSWILEARDHYPSQNLLAEGSLLQPYTGLWVKNETFKRS